LKAWCEKIWTEKEERLRKFYAQKTYEGFERRLDIPWNAMHLAFFGWTVVTIFFVYLFLTNSFAFYWAIACILFFVFFSAFTIGIQQFEIDLFRKFDCNSEKSEKVCKKD